MREGIHSAHLLREAREGGSLDPLTRLTRAAQGPVPTLEGLADRVARLTPSHRDPERFFMDRAELAGELRRLARALGRTA
jgi:hypothetical protein